MPGLIDVPEWAKSHPYIYLWGRELGSSPDYIRNEVRKAQKMNAPANATGERTEPGTGKHIRWATTDDITNMPLRARFGLPDTAPVLAKWFGQELQGVLGTLERLNNTLKSWEDKAHDNPAVYFGAMTSEANRKLAGDVHELGLVIYRKLA